MNHMSLVRNRTTEETGDGFDLAAASAARENDRYSLHTKHLNEQMVRVLQTIGYAMLVRGAEPDVASLLEPGLAVELSKMYVLPDHHGDGTAAALMEAGIAWAAKVGARDVWLGVNQANHRAQTFYRKHGFVVAGTRTFQVGAIAENDFVMVRTR